MFEVFVVEEEPNIEKHLAGFAERESLELYALNDEETALRAMGKYPHLWVLDTTAPHIDGYLLYQQIKIQSPDIPVLLLTVSSDFERIAKLDLCNDDFLMSPLSSLELVLRTRHLLKRSYPESNQAFFRINLHPYTVYENKREVLLGTERVDLTSKEFQLLLYFARNRGKVLSREQIVYEIWGVDSRISERSVDDLVRRLRSKMKDLSIETLYGYGYRMVLE